jgi:sugar phosphate isomerase/epimerase
MIDGRTALEYFANLLDPAVVLEVDTYWVAVGGQGPVDILTELGDRVKFIHIKDGPLSQNFAPSPPSPAQSPRMSRSPLTLTPIAT